MTADIVRKGVQERLDRLGVDKVDLLQFHWWTFEHPAWLDALHEMARLKEEGLIGAIGVTNFDAAHLALALADGVPVATNQVSFSLVDRRAAGPLSALCRDKGVKLLAYGTLCGGFLSGKWLGKPEPTDIADWSRSKYKRFIDTAGGWDVFQGILGAAAPIATKHGVSISNVATRWVLEHEAVAAAIIGARHHRERAPRRQPQSYSASRSMPKTRRGSTTRLPRPRRSPAIAATSIAARPTSRRRAISAITSTPSLRSMRREPVPGRPGRLRVSSGSVWEPIAGYSRAVRVKDTIRVSGTTATHAADRCVAPGDPGAQTTYILDKIAASITALGGRIEDVVRTRIYLRDAAKWEPVSRAHGRVFGEIKPANTMVEAGDLIGDYEVEIEAEAVVGD